MKVAGARVHFSGVWGGQWCRSNPCCPQVEPCPAPLHAHPWPLLTSGPAPLHAHPHGPPSPGSAPLHPHPRPLLTPGCAPLHAHPHGPPSPGPAPLHAHPHSQPQLLPHGQQHQDVPELCCHPSGCTRFSGPGSSVCFCGEDSSGPGSGGSRPAPRGTGLRVPTHGALFCRMAAGRAPHPDSPAASFRG